MRCMVCDLCDLDTEDINHRIFADLMLKLSEEDFELFVVHCWLLWNQRNSVLLGYVPFKSYCMMLCMTLYCD